MKKEGERKNKEKKEIGKLENLKTNTLLMKYIYKLD